MVRRMSKTKLMGNDNASHSYKHDGECIKKEFHAASVVARINKDRDYQYGTRLISKSMLLDQIFLNLMY